MANCLPSAMDANSGLTFRQLAVFAIALSLSFAGVCGLPTLPMSQSISTVPVNTSLVLAPPYPRPPEDPTCPGDSRWGTTMGRPSYNDCDYILSYLYPKDPLAKPVMRNYYTASADLSRTLQNFRLPYEQSHGFTSTLVAKNQRKAFGGADTGVGTCSVQVLLATNFLDVPHDEATWNDLRGAARTVFRSCVLGKGTGGVVSKNGTLLA